LAKLPQRHEQVGLGASARFDEHHIGMRHGTAHMAIEHVVRAGVHPER
jgi:hypothetical protein